MPDLRLDKINKYYGDVHAVKDVSISVPAGEFVALVGPSGCGKSTLLRSIAGLEEVSGGEIVLGERNITGLAPRQRNIAMVFQSYALYPFLSVYENIAFGLRARKVPEAEVETQVRWAADLLHINDYLERYPRELSGGQRQRVAIGRAIVRDADLFLFDEPLSNLDAKLRDGMREEIKYLHKQLGKTFIYVTHDQIEAMTLAERIVLLKDGVIEQMGGPLDLFERPDNTFVAGFLGSPPMNFLDVEVSNRGRRIALPGGQTIALRKGVGIADGTYVWGVRPEHVQQAGGNGSIKVKMEVVQPTGARAYGSFRLGEARMVAELEAHAIGLADSTLDLTIAVDRTSFFDRNNGQAVR